MSRLSLFAILSCLLLALLASAGGVYYFVYTARRAQEMALRDEMRALSEAAEFARRAEVARLIDLRDTDLRDADLRDAEKASVDADTSIDDPRPAVPLEGDHLAVRFGDPTRSLSLSRLPWKRLSRELAELHREFEASEGDEEALARIAVRYEALAERLSGLLPTGLKSHAEKFGEMTHPIVAANLLSAMLENEGLPLEPEQIRKLADLGTVYEVETESLQVSYPEDASRLRKIIDEIELKRGTAAQVERALTSEQREAIRVFDADTMLGANLLSPGWSLDVVEVSVATREDAFAAFEEHLNGLGVDSIPDEVRSSWLESSEHFFDGQAGGQAVLQKAVLAGWAQVRAIEKLSESASAETRDRLMGASRVFVPSRFGD